MRQRESIGDGIGGRLHAGERELLAKLRRGDYAAIQCRAYERHIRGQRIDDLRRGGLLRAGTLPAG